MSQPLIISVPHRLGRQEARRRLDRGIGRLEDELGAGVAGHYVGHHGVLGATAGCMIGHHEATKHAREKAQQQQEQQH